MIKGYEYIRISSDLGSLYELNSLSINGWKVVFGDKDYLLLERPLSEERRIKALQFYSKALATKRP